MKKNSHSSKTLTAKRPRKSDDSAFAKGMEVAFTIKHPKAGVVKGQGVITKLVPRGAVRGGARLTVVDAKEREWRPYPAQCRPIQHREKAEAPPSNSAQVTQVTVGTTTGRVSSKKRNQANTPKSAPKSVAVEVPSLSDLGEIAPGTASDRELGTLGEPDDVVEPPTTTSEPTIDDLPPLDL